MLYLLASHSKVCLKRGCSLFTCPLFQILPEVVPALVFILLYSCCHAVLARVNFIYELLFQKLAYYFVHLSFSSQPLADSSRSFTLIYFFLLSFSLVSQAELSFSSLAFSFPLWHIYSSSIVLALTLRSLHIYFVFCNSPFLSLSLKVIIYISPFFCSTFLNKLMHPLFIINI